MKRHRLMPGISRAVPAIRAPEAAIRGVGKPIDSVSKARPDTAPSSESTPAQPAARPIPTTQRGKNNELRGEIAKLAKRNTALTRALEFLVASIGTPVPDRAVAAVRHAEHLLTHPTED